MHVFRFPLTSIKRLDSMKPNKTTYKLHHSKIKTRSWLLFIQSHATQLQIAHVHLKRSSKSSSYDTYRCSTCRYMCTSSNSSIYCNILYCSTICLCSVADQSKEFYRFAKLEKKIQECFLRNTYLCEKSPAFASNQLPGQMGVFHISSLVIT